jgi:hypothetical protein
MQLRMAFRNGAQAIEMIPGFFVEASHAGAVRSLAGTHADVDVLETILFIYSQDGGRGKGRRSGAVGGLVLPLRRPGVSAEADVQPGARRGAVTWGFTECLS